MLVLMLLATLEAHVQGTKAPLDVELLLRGAGDEWTEVARRHVPESSRGVRFDGLASGVYQLRVRGPHSSEQLGTKLALGADDTRRATVAIAPSVLSGRITLGGTNLGGAVLVLRHRELQWSARIETAADGTFRVPLWQRGTFDYEVRSSALPTSYTFWTELGDAPLHVDIPDGRITGVVRDAATGAPVGGATVVLQSNAGDREEYAKLATALDGRFDFAGIKHGTHIVRVFPAEHLQPEPVTFALDANQRHHELDVRVHAGRSVPVLVLDAANDPVAGASILAVVDAKVRARTTTDEDGRATVAVPPGESATLFVIPNGGLFAMHRVPRAEEKGRVKIYLPQSASSLHIRATTTTGSAMPPFSLLMRYNGELVPAEVAEALGAIQGLQLMAAESEAHLRNIPSGSYEFWPYRTDAEAESIAASASVALAPIQVNVRSGENRIAVKFAAR